MGNIFMTVLYEPLYNLLVLFYDLLPWGGLGLSIIILTVLVKGLLFPLTFRSLKSQKELQEIQPKIKEIRELHKDNKELMAKELMAVYKNHNVNPFASCLPMIAQIVVFLTLFQVLRAGIETVREDLLYPFVNNPGVMEHIFLWINLAEPSIILAVLAGVTQFFQARQMVSRRPPQAARASAASLDEDMQASMNKMMLYVLPVVMIVMGATSIPGGLTLYILVSTLLTLILYAIFLRPKPAAEASGSEGAPPQVTVEQS